jgi:mRNA interferase MazF
MVKRGDIWLVNLDPTVGSEIQKTRLCIIVSPPEMHDHLRTVIVAPMTTANKPAPFRIAIVFQGKRGLILLDQIGTLDKVRLVKRLGKTPEKPLLNALRTLQEMFAV